MASPLSSDNICPAAFSDTPEAISSADSISEILVNDFGLVALDAAALRALACSTNGVARRFFSSARATKPARTAS